MIMYFDMSSKIFWTFVYVCGMIARSHAFMQQVICLCTMCFGQRVPKQDIVHQVKVMK